jgi:hypothetical protein
MPEARIERDEVRTRRPDGVMTSTNDANDWIAAPFGLHRVP